jgi:hypothetical protein
MSEEQKYNVIYSPGTSTGLFDPRTGTEDRSGEEAYAGDMNVSQLTESEIKERWEADTFLQQQFGSFDNYMGYVKESSELFENVDWWESKGIDTRTQSERMREGDDLGRGAGQVDLVYDKKQSDDSARKSGYQQWLMGEENQALMEKYGVEQTVYNDKGDKYEWMGNGYTLTDEADELDFGDIAKVGLMVAMGVASGAGVSAALNAVGSAANAFAVSLGKSLGGLQATTISAAAGGMAGSAVSQSLMTGSVDPLKLVQSGLTAGIVDAARILGSAASQLDGSSIDDFLAVMDSKTLSTLDQAINNVAGGLGTGFDTALNIVKGVAIGVINEGDLEGIVINAASTLGADKIVNYIDDNLGFAVPNLFQEGTTDINPDAVEEVSRIFIKDTLSGDLSPETLLDAGIGYVREDGSLAPLDPGFFEGLRDKFPEASFSDLLPDFELISGADFGIDFVKGEDRPFDAEDPFAEVNDEDPSDVIQFKYNQGVVDAVTNAIENVRETGREIDDEVLQPVKEALEAGGRAIDDTVLQPVKEFIEQGGRVIDDTVLQPVKEFIEEILPESPESPEGIEGIEGSGIDVDLKIPEFKSSKPFGEDLKQMAPLGAPRLAPGVEIFGKAQVNAPYDPTRAGSPITAGLFSEYIG